MIFFDCFSPSNKSGSQNGCGRPSRRQESFAADILFARGLRALSKCSCVSPRSRDPSSRDPQSLKQNEEIINSAIMTDHLAYSLVIQLVYHALVRRCRV